MAMIKRFTCIQCREHVEEARSGHDYSNVCYSCLAKESKSKRKIFLAGRAALSIQERLSLLEQWQYDYKPPIDIMDVRFG